MEGLYFHLDIGHFSAVAFKRGLSPEKELDKFLKNLRNKLLHVHISDAKKEVDHLPLGVGVIDWKKCLDLLQEIKYEGTLTLEVFVKDREYLLISKRKLEEYLSSSN